MTGEDWNFKLESFVAVRRKYYTKLPANPWKEEKVKRRSELAKERVAKVYKTKKAQVTMQAVKGLLALECGACLTD